MKKDFTQPSPFEVLGLLASATPETLERRAEALAALARLGVAATDDEVPPAPDVPRDDTAVAEAARTLRDPHRWLQEAVLWPEGNLAPRALSMAADLLEGMAGNPREPGTLVRQLAQEYLAEETRETLASDQPARAIAAYLAPPEQPPLFLGPQPTGRPKNGGDPHDPNDR